MRKIRILMPDNPLMLGGVETVCLRLFPELAARVESIRWLTHEFLIDRFRPHMPGNLSFSAWLAPASSATGLLQRLAARSKSPASSRLVRFAESCRIRAEIRRFDPTHLFYHCVYDQYPPPLGLPLAGIVYDLNYRFFGEDTFDAPLGAWSRRADALIVCARSIKSDFEKAFPSIAERLHLVPLGANHIVQKAPESRPLREASAVPVLLMPASFARHKGHLYLLEAAAALARQGKAFRMIFVGGSTEKLVGSHPLAEPRLEAARAFYRANEHLLAPHVEARGFCPAAELEDLYSAADAVVLPTEYEGFGLPLTEALGHGLPVVCSRIDPFVEQAERHGFGRFITWAPPGDSAALADALGSLLDRFPLPAIRAGEIPRLLGNWTWSDSARSIAEILTSLDAGSAPRGSPITVAKRPCPSEKKL
jgi:glycosyltransferase involved in cell wall biosynthesis